MERTKTPKLRNSSKGDSNTGFLDYESGILPRSKLKLFLTHKKTPNTEECNTRRKSGRPTKQRPWEKDVED